MGILKSSGMTKKLFTCGGKETFRNVSWLVLGNFFNHSLWERKKTPHKQHCYNLLSMTHPLGMVPHDGRLSFLKHIFREKFSGEKTLKYTLL